MYRSFEKININIFGEAHSQEIGVIISNMPKNEKIDLKALQSFVDSRKAENNYCSTKRCEVDKVEIVSGIKNGFTTGEDIKAIIKNNAQCSADYDNLAFTLRPSHADFVSMVKDNLQRCSVGGGRFSGRMTAPLCIAGGIAKQLLSKKNIEVASYIRSIGEIEGDSFSNRNVSLSLFNSINTKIKALSRADEMAELVEKTAKKGDSVGGVVDCVVFGMPIGIGDNLFNGLEGRISQSVFAIPAVKGVSFGEGFMLSKTFGSIANDPFALDGDKIITLTNHSGGINGGISNGMPITVSAAFRPTPSIAIPQKTVNIKTKTPVTIEIGGRHDVCVAIRGRVAVEAAVALAVLDAVL